MIFTLPLLLCPVIFFRLPFLPQVFLLITRKLNPLSSQNHTCKSSGLCFVIFKYSHSFCLNTSLSTGFCWDFKLYLAQMQTHFFLCSILDIWEALNLIPVTFSKYVASLAAVHLPNSYPYSAGSLSIVSINIFSYSGVTLRKFPGLLLSKTLSKLSGSP